MRLLRSLAGLALLCMTLAGCGAGPRAEIVLTAAGCQTNHFRLVPDREPIITIANQAATPMVFTLPVMNRWLALQPGEQAEFELPRYIMGNFDFFCLEEAEHTRVSGGNPYLCVMEPAELAPVALSQGLFEIEPHNRIEEITGS